MMACWRDRQARRQGRQCRVRHPSDGRRNLAWLMAGDTLYWVDLATGKATEAAKIAGVSGTVKDIAVMGM